MLKCAVTGGPCGGKTEIMSHLTQSLEERGYKVFVVPETATELILNGIVPGDKIPDDKFQSLVMDKQLSKEALYQKAASYYGEKSVIFYDRGLLDAKAYVDDKTFNQLLLEHNMTMQDVYGHYDTVLHMTTAADGAEAFYQWNDPSKPDTGNNAARSETPEQAREKDRKTMQAWIGHPHLRVFDNSTDFKGKINRVTKEVFAALGEPIPKEVERKFLIQKPTSDVMKQFGTVSSQQIIQTYLISDNSDIERRVRQRGTESDGFSFYYTEKTDIGLGERFEQEERITQYEYVAYLGSADTSLHQVMKTRDCFVYQNQYFELDTYPFSKDYAILEIEVNDMSDVMICPKGIHIIKEVTGDPAFRNHTLAQTQSFDISPKKCVTQVSHEDRVKQAEALLPDFSISDSVKRQIDETHLEF